MNGPDDSDEPRVRDLIAREPTREDLARWFDLPSFASLDDMPVEAPPPSEIDKLLARRAEVLRHVDPALVARLDAHTARAEQLDRVRPPQRAWLEGRSPITFHDDWIPALPADEELPEVEIPAALLRDLKICTPQAFLRDLHRPEKEFYVQMQSPWAALDDDDEPPPADPMAPVRETLRRDYRVRALPSTTGSLAESWSDLRALLARPWAEGKREEARRREAELLAGKDSAAAAVRTREGAP